MRPIALPLACAGMLLVLSPAQGVHAQGVFVRGDCDQSASVDITDPIFALTFLFAGGRGPDCFDACDANDSEAVDIADPIFTLLYLFSGGDEPPSPFELEGLDPPPVPPRLDTIGCANGRLPPNELRVAPTRVVFDELGQVVYPSVLAVAESGEVEDVRVSAATSYRIADPAIATVGEGGAITSIGVGATSLQVRYRGVVRSVAISVPPEADGAPVLSLLAPTDGAVLVASRVLVRGVVSPPTAEVLVDGQPAERNGPAFAREVELAVGENTVEVVAASGGRERRMAVRLERVEPGSDDAVGPDGEPLPVVVAPFVSAPDTTPPELQISYPQSGAELASSRVEVRGTVDDPEADVEVDGVLAAVEDGEFQVVSWLPPGRSTIRVEASDRVGNRSSRELSVEVDDVLARLRIDAPAGDSTIVVGAGVFRLSGSVEPPGSGVRVAVHTVERAAVVVGTSWHVDLDLPAGVHDLVLTASSPSAAGVRYTGLVRSLVVDERPPQLEVLFPPPEGFRTSAASVQIVGRAAEDGRVPRLADGPVTVTADGSVVALAGEAFLADVALAPGENVIDVTARDQRGNAVTRTLRLVRGVPQGPTLEIAAAPEVELEPGAAVDLVVRRRDGSGRPEAGVQVELVVEAGDGSIGGARRQVAVTDTSGLARVVYTAGAAVGPRHVIVARALDASPAVVAVRVAPGSDSALVLADPEPLVGVAGAELERSLAVRVVDAAGGERPGVVTFFRVLAGDAELIGGGSLVQATTDHAGVARARLRVPVGTDSESVVRVSYTGAEPLVTTVRGQVAGPAADTEITGNVTDARGRPLAGARVRLRGLEAAGFDMVTGASGAFLFVGVPVGEALLEIVPGGAHDGARRRVRTLSGRRTSVGVVRLVAIEAGARQALARFHPSTAGSVLLAVPALPGARLAVDSESIDFGGAAETVGLASPPLSLAPAPAPSGTNPLGLVSVLPNDLSFVTPPTLSLPAFDAVAGERLALLEYRAAAGGFVELATIAVTSASTSVSVPPELAPGRGGWWFVSRRGPSGGRTGTLTGRVQFVRPGSGEIPQRPDSAVVGWNVYAHSGEMFVDEIDLEIPGRGLPYRFRRRYESGHAFAGSLGYGWEHEYEDRRLYMGLGAGNLARADGVGGFCEYLRDSETGGFVSPVGVFSRLFVDADGFFVERDPNGRRWRYWPLDGLPAAGRLESVADAAGNTLAFVRREDGLLDRVVDTLGREIVYEHDAEGRITAVVDFTGRVLTFENDGRGDLVAVTRPAVVETPNTNDFPAGKRTEYRYSFGFADERLNHNLRQIIDPRQVLGAKLPRIDVEYGEEDERFDRVVLQRLGGTNESGVSAGGELTFDYAALRSAPAGGPSVPRSVAELEVELLTAAWSTIFTDERDVRTEIVSSGAGLPLRERVYSAAELDSVRPRDATRRIPPPGTAPAFYENRWRWTREGLLEELVHSGGDRRVYRYDEGAPLRHAQRALVEERWVPAPEAPGGAVDAVTTYRRDPLFGGIVEEVAPRGNLEGADAAEFRTLRLLDYQEAATAEELALAVGCDVDTIVESLARAGIALGLGDLDGGGADVTRAGLVVRAEHPPVLDLGDTLRVDVETWSYNDYGQLIAHADASGRTRRFEYHPATDPEGDGTSTEADDLDDRTGGFLAREIAEDRDGHELITSFVYDPWGYPARVTNPRGHAVVLAHNALGQLVQESLPTPLRYRRQRFYDADDNLVRVRLENFTVTDEGVPFLVSDNRWLETWLEHDLLGRPVEVRREVEGEDGGDEHHAVTGLRYDAAGRLVRRSHGIDGTDEAWLRDERGRVLQHVQAVGTADEATWTTRRDLSGAVVVSIDAADSDGDGEPEWEEVRRDGFGRPLAHIDALGGARVEERDVDGRVLSEAFVDRDGLLLERRSFRHDARGRVHEVWRSLFGGVTPGGGSQPGRVLLERFWYDGEGRQLVSEDVRGRRTTREYDGAGRLIAERGPLGGRTSYQRDECGNVVRETIETLTVDALTEPGVDDPDYDAEGRFRERASTVRIFDGLDRLTVLIQPDGGVWRVRYDSASNPVLITDPEGPTILAASDPEIGPHLDLVDEGLRTRLNAHGNRVRQAFDGLGRRLETVHELRTGGTGGGSIDVENPFDADGRITEKWRWDDLGRLVARVDDVGREYGIDYDGAGYIRRRTWADGAEEVHERDRDGSLRALVDPGGTRIEQELDALHRVVERRVERGEGIAGTTLQRFGYDGLSRVEWAFDNNDPDDPDDDVELVRRRDSLGRQVEEARRGQLVRSGHDVEGALVWRELPGGRLISTPRDEDGRMRALADEATTYAAYQWFGSGLLRSQALSNGLRLEHVASSGDGPPRKSGYDFSGRVVEAVWTSSSTEFRHGFSYGRDRQGHPLWAAAQHRPDRRGDVWRFDSAYRLRYFLPQVFNPSSPPPEPLEKLEIFADGNHNWRFLLVDLDRTSLEVDARNRYTSTDGEPIVHDGAGNLRSAGALELVYDGLRRLVEVRRNDDLIVLHAYDAAGCEHPVDFRGRGRRVLKDVRRPQRDQVAGVVTYVHAGDELVEERTADSRRLQYLWEDAAEGRRAVVCLASSNTSPTLAMALLADARGAVTAVVDQKGAIVETFEYGPHGAPIVSNRFGNPVEFPPSGSSLAFGGIAHDFEIGLHLVGARHFDPHLGRYVSAAGEPLSRDPLALNPYVRPSLPGLPGEVTGQQGRRRRGLPDGALQVGLDGVLNVGVGEGSASGVLRALGAAYSGSFPVKAGGGER